MNASLIAQDGLVEFMLLPEEVRREVGAWHAQLATVTKPVRRALEKIAARMGVSLGTARRKYDVWRRQRDWRALVNRAKVPQGRGLDPDFLEYWKKLCSENSRSALAAYREFVRRFKAGDPIPGLPHGISRRTLPPGYSYDNLMRHQPTAFERTAARIGRSAAADFRPKVFTRRLGLQVGQRYIFDDMWHDFMVVFIGQRKPMRLLQLHAHDLYSGCQFARGLKARIEEADGRRVNLSEDEMLFLLAHVLSETGFHPDGCILMVEHGTAAIREWLEKMLHDISGGTITVDRSGIEGASAFAGQYAGRGKGNFRFKASLESLGNLIHNETANLLQFPGQTGSNSRLNLPEELAGREKHAIQLEMALMALPAQLRQQLRSPFLEVNQAKWLVGEVMERINRRTEHELEGWLECGLTAMDLDIPGVGVMPQAHYAALSAERRAAVDAIAQPAPRKLSPREVFDAGRRNLIKFRPEQSAALLQERQGVEVSVGDDHLITFEDRTISPEPLRYLAHHFPTGEKFRGVVNPWSPERLHLFDARGRWAGIVDAWQRVRRDDLEGLHARMGAAAKVEKELLRPLAARGAELTRERLAVSEGNIGVVKAERDEEAERQRAAKAALMD